jgi:hypothetical protein
VNRLWAPGLALSVAALTTAPQPLRVTFHHIHVNDPAPDHLLAYYGKLFDSSSTRPAAIGGVRGIESGGIYLLVTPVQRPAADEGSAGWHFGWGSVSLDEAYDRHRMQEIEWELPLESFAKGLHLHLESADPVRAGEWYRDTFGASLETAAAQADVQPLRAMYRRPAAIARLEGIALAIYKAAVALEPSRGHRIDHIAFRTDLAEVRRRTDLKVLEPAGRLGDFDTMTIEGPDRLSIELIERQPQGGRDD